MKVNKLIYSIREAVKEFTDDSELSDRLILFLIDTKRAKYLSQRINSYKTSLPSSALQSLCIGLEDVNRYKCGIDINCTTLRRSKQKLPTFFDTVTGNTLINVNSLDIVGRPFSLIDANMVPYISYSSFNTQVFAFLDDDNYLYLISEGDGHKLIDCVEVSGIFEAPGDLQVFANCCDCDEDTDTSCFSLESEYPLSTPLVDVIRIEVITELLKLKGIEEDKNNNSEDDKAKR